MSDEGRPLHKYHGSSRVGTRETEGLFDSPVEITEKLDGSQFAFGQIGGEFYCRSKGKMIDLDKPDKLFIPAIVYAKLAYEASFLPNGVTFYGEAFQKPHHGVIKYERSPVGNIALFAVKNVAGHWMGYDFVARWAEVLGMEPVQLLHYGDISDLDEIKKLASGDSQLGGGQKEGVVIKRFYDNAKYGPSLMVGKYVNEKFQEVHDRCKIKSAKRDNFIQDLGLRYRSENRWQKAVRRFEEEGTLLRSPKDIGPLIKAIKEDVLKEEREEIKELLFAEYQKQILETTIRGFPQWYQDNLMEGMFDE